MNTAKEFENSPEYRKSLHHLSDIVSSLHLSEEENNRLIDGISQFHRETAQAAFLCAVAEYDKTFRKYLIQQESEANGNDF